MRDSDDEAEKVEPRATQPPQNSKSHLYHILEVLAVQVYMYLPCNLVKQSSGILSVRPHVW